MGKGQIQSHIGNGLYGVKLLYDWTRLDAEVTALTGQISALEAKIADMADGTDKDVLILRKTALEKRKSQLLALKSDPVVSAWCADLTEDLSGQVGTIEVPGEIGDVLIQPGHDGNAAYDASRDGQLQNISAGPAAQAFYNLAMLPGWQKWKPTFRFGTITAIDHNAHTCSVSLEPADSSAQGIPVNQSASMSGVPIEYMECDSAPFSVGDEVLVKFVGQNWQNPKVIGFKESPKPCEGFIFTMTRGDGEELVSEVVFTVYDSSQAMVFSGGSESEYVEAEGNVWKINDEGFSDNGQDPNGYWWQFRYTGAETGEAPGYTIQDTQYPDKYVDSEKWNPGDRISKGSYSMEMPLWRIEGPAWVGATNQTVYLGRDEPPYKGPTHIFHLNPPNGDEYHIKTVLLCLHQSGPSQGSPEPAQLKMTVYSSVPYKVKRAVPATADWNEVLTNFIITEDCVVPQEDPEYCVPADPYPYLKAHTWDPFFCFWDFDWPNPQFRIYADLPAPLSDWEWIWGEDPAHPAPAAGRTADDQIVNNPSVEGIDHFIYMEENLGGAQTFPYVCVEDQKQAEYVFVSATAHTEDYMARIKAFYDLDSGDPP